MPFPNKDTQFPTGEKQVETARKGGKASGEARRQKRDLRRALEILLEKTVSKDKADFEYIRDGRKFVEDVKGMKTEVYKLKKKLFEYKYPNLEIVEV